MSFRLFDALRAANMIILVEIDDNVEEHHDASDHWGAEDDPVTIVAMHDGPCPDFDDQDIELDPGGRVKVKDVDGRLWAVILKVVRPVTGEDIRNAMQRGGL